MPSKRRRTTASGKKSSKADVSNICQESPEEPGCEVDRFSSLPLDVLLEVCQGYVPGSTTLKHLKLFQHLLPLDLLHLARTTKAFRSILMHRSSSFVWNAARMNVPGLPECPDMSEPAFARLAFDKHCHVCLPPSIG
jgi:hypothetical protein